MIYSLLFILLVIAMMFMVNKHYEFLKKKNRRFDKILAKIRKIFTDVTEVTFFGTYDSASFYHLRYLDRTRKILRIQTIPSENLIEFSFINENQWYKNQEISRYDGDIILRANIDSVSHNPNILDKVLGYVFADTDILKNKLRNKNILFDEFYEGLISMRHKNNGQSFTLGEYSDVIFIKNLFNERNS